MTGRVARGEGSAKVKTWALGQNLREVEMLAIVELLKVSFP